MACRRFFDKGARVALFQRRAVWVVSIALVPIAGNAGGIQIIQVIGTTP